MALLHQRWFDLHHCYCLLLHDAWFPHHSCFVAHSGWAITRSDEDGRRLKQYRTQKCTATGPSKRSHRLDSMVASNRRVLLACWGVIQTLFPYNSGHHGIQSNSDTFTLCSSFVYWHYNIILRYEVCSLKSCYFIYHLTFCNRHSDVTRDRFWHIVGPVSMGIIGFIIATLTMNTSIRYLSL